MERLRNLKLVSIIIVAVAGALLFVYVVSNKVLAQKLFVKESGSTLAKAGVGNEMCELDEVVSENKNPNAHLFVSCGGFLE